MKSLPKKGIVTIAFDDAYLATYKHAIRYLNKLGIKSTIAVSPFTVGKKLEKRRVMGLKELKNSIKRRHEIASHTLSHVNLLDLSKKDKKKAISEIADSKKELKKILSKKIDSFVFPYIKKNTSKELRRIAKKYYASIRVTSDRPSFNKLPLKDSYNIKSFAVMKKHSLSYLKKQIDRVQKEKSWLVEVFHLVGTKNTLSAHRPKPYRFFMHINDFKKHIDYILSKDVLILTQKDASREL